MLISIAPVFLGAFLSWFKKARPLSVLLLIVGYAAALVSGFVQPIGIAGVMVVALLAWVCSQTLDGVRGVALHIMFLVWAGLLFLHVLPGFQNPLIMGPVSFTPDAIPFKMYFNFDKAAIGFALILLYAQFVSSKISNALSWLVRLGPSWGLFLRCCRLFGWAPFAGSRSCLIVCGFGASTTFLWSRLQRRRCFEASSRAAFRAG
jgi:hypothetical protein